MDRIARNTATTTTATTQADEALRRVTATGIGPRQPGTVYYDGDRTVMVTLRLPNGRYVGDVWLSKQDVNDLADATVGLAAVRDYELVHPLPDADTVDMDQALTALEKHANGEEL